MEFESGSIDLVSLSNTLHHLPIKEKVLSGIKRVLKPRGIVLINEMICNNQSEKQKKLLFS
jgi:ubiquinone/menaquinone biosynthesis C-methylase UbiE